MSALPPLNARALQIARRYAHCYASRIPRGLTQVGHEFVRARVRHRILTRLPAIPAEVADSIAIEAVRLGVT